MNVSAEACSLSKDELLTLKNKKVMIAPKALYVGECPHMESKFLKWTKNTNSRVSRELSHEYELLLVESE